MTKIKNTKKGMAKKTLSMSLVVAMLATSNVPVWAAEFSDGSDVAVTSEAAAPVAEDTEAFSDETVDAPVVDDAAEEVSTAQANENYTVKTNLSLKKVDWNTGLTLEKPENKTAEFTIENKDGVVTPWAKAEVYAGNGGLLTTVDTKTNTDLAKALETVKYGLTAYKTDRNVTVKVYVANDTNPVCEFNSVIQPVDISKWTCAITSGGTASKTYNGKVQNPDVTITAPSGSSFTVGGSTSEVTIQYADVTEAKNVGSYDYSVIGVESEGYTGKVAGTKTFDITPATADATNLAVTVSGTVAYNGDVKSLVKVIDKYTGEALPSELYNVTAANSNVGKYDKSNLTVTLVNSATINKKTVNNNFTGTVTADLLSGDYTVTAFDLSKLSEKYTVNVATKKANVAVDPTKDVTFTDKATGKTYKYADVIPTSDVEYETTNNAAPGNGTFTITPKKGVTNVTGTFTTAFTVVNNVVTATDVAFPVGFDFKDGNKPSTVKLALDETRVSTYINSKLTGLVYNGTAQEPLKEAFSNLVLSNSATTSDVKLVLGTDYDLVYSNNTDSDAVKGVTKTDKSKIAKVTFVFKGNYTGTFSYEFNIAKAQATITGNDVSYVAGKNSYDASVSVKTADKKDVPASEYTVTTTEKGTKVGTFAKATVVFNNKNYDITNNDPANKGVNTAGCAYLKEVKSKIVGKDLKNCTATIEGNYVYTGESISPKLTVKDGDIVLVEGKDYKVSSKNNINAGKALVTITAVNGSNYTGSLTLEYEIKKANLADAKVTLTSKGEYGYNGLIVTPKIASVTIGSVSLNPYDPIEKKGDYTFTYDEAVEAGTYNFTLKALDGSKNVEGEYKGTFKVTPNQLTACFAPKLAATYTDYTNKPALTLTTDDTGAYYTGKEITIDSFKKKYVVVDKYGKVLTEGKDYKLEYKDNVNAGKASVVAYGIGNYATTKDGKPVEIASMYFYIGAKETITSTQIQKVANVEYAGGLPVEPEVVVYDQKGNRLIQGTDYTVETVDATTKAPITEIGNYTGVNVIVKGKGAYIVNNNKSDDNTGVSVDSKLTWKVTKKDIVNTTISVDKDNNVTVLNGRVVVPASEYDVKFSDDKKKVTVTAKANSTKYTGSKEITLESAKVGQAMIANVVVKGNTVTPVLSSEVDEAVGYDYVIATEEDYKNGRVGVSKNILKTNTDFHYVQQGTYYAYCHAWKRNAEGKKVFGEWSNIVKFTVTATTPSTPTVKSVKVKGSTVTVTYTVSEDATGYDVVLGSAVKKVNGEKRPVDYGTLVKKNIKGNVVTATFKNVPAGKYYAGVHSFNKTSENGSKVFSKWSNSKAVTVK